MKINNSLVKSCPGFIDHYSRYLKDMFVVAAVVINLVACSALKKAEYVSEYSLHSPNGRIALTITSGNRASPSFSVTFDGKSVLSPSVIDMVYATEAITQHELVLVSEYSQAEVIELPWGQFKQLKNSFNGVKFNLVDRLSNRIITTLEFKVLDDAVAFRHGFAQSSLIHDDKLIEKTQLNFTEDLYAWSYNGMSPTKQTPSILASANETLSLPITFTSEQLPALAFQEAGRTETAMLKLKTVQGKSQLTVVSEPIKKADAPEFTSWRVIQIADTAGDLITSQALVSLSPPSKIQDTSWIKTGKSFWDWRVRGEQYEEHTYALDNESLRRMIKFAAENNMQYVMIDANWYGPEHEVSSDPFTEIEGLNIKGLIKQANEKGIGFILYLNDKASVNYDLDKLFETWSSWGAAGVKYGFMKVTGKEKVKKTLKIVELAAKHKLLINFHDRPIVHSGMRRTWPNWVTREAVHAQADGRHTFQPSGFVEMAHVNGLSGPQDMSNGFFKLNGLKESRNYVRADVNSTVASEVARALIVYSGLIIFPDAPEEYLAKQDLFEFLEKMPATWDESKVLSSDITQHIVTARRSGDDWFVGAAINEEGGVLPLDLSFLDADTLYQARVYADGDDAHYINNREQYVVSTIEVTRDDSLKMKLAPGGGQAIWFTPVNRRKNR